MMPHTSAVLWNWWGCRYNLWERMKCYPTVCFSAACRLYQKSMQDFKLFKLPFPVKTSSLCTINAVNRCCRCGSLTCYQTIQFPAASPTSWAFASSPNLPLMLWALTQQKRLPGSSSELQLHLENKVTEEARNYNASLSWKLCCT